MEGGQEIVDEKAVTSKQIQSIIITLSQSVLAGYMSNGGVLNPVELQESKAETA